MFIVIDYCSKYSTAQKKLNRKLFKRNCDFLEKQNKSKLNSKLIKKHENENNCLCDRN